ncbi:MAG: YraN family protein [Bacteroidia bacterium]|nr:MAG: YraN family protein [Bacteroidia bacterium]
MATHNDLGNKGEAKAAEFLQSNGYTIHEKNYRTGHWEIDIIAEKDNCIVFVEVKTRTINFIENPFQAVTKKKQRFLIKAANIYIEKNEIDLEARFDIITVIEKGTEILIDHFEDAFYPLA